jgi:hypothetical protein
MSNDQWLEMIDDWKLMRNDDWWSVMIDDW